MFGIILPSPQHPNNNKPVINRPGGDAGAKEHKPVAVYGAQVAAEYRAAFYVVNEGIKIFSGSEVHGGDFDGGIQDIAGEEEHFVVLFGGED